LESANDDDNNIYAAPSQAAEQPERKEAETEEEPEETDEDELGMVVFDNVIGEKLILESTHF
jgi:ribosomal protein L12E/L44/L45/RPP1/RPP2